MSLALFSCTGGGWGEAGAGTLCRGGKALYGEGGTGACTGTPSMNRQIDRTENITFATALMGRFTKNRIMSNKVKYLKNCQLVSVPI